MYKGKEVNKNVKNIFLSICDIFSLAKSKTGNNIYTEMTNMFCI